MKEFRISDEAVARLRTLKAASVEARPDHAVRIYMDLAFCGGPQWGFMLAMYDENVDECCDFDGFKIIIDRDLLEGMGGIDVQLVDDDEFGDSFLVTPLDPNVQAFFEASKQSGCGCHGGCGGCGGCHGGCGCGGDDECGCGGCGGCHGGCGCDCDDEDDCDCGCCHGHHEDEE